MPLAADQLPHPARHLGPRSARPPRGKWLWILPVWALDAGRRLVKQGVKDGKLGPGAKVATLGSPLAVTPPADR
jgi:hypothetical protein